MTHPALMIGAARVAPKMEKPTLPVDLRSIPLALVRPSPTNPRRSMREETIEELAASIRDRGLQSPIKVRRDPLDRSRYIIVAGHRRFAAHQKIGLPEILAIVADDRYTEEQADVDAIVENLQREDVTAIDHGHAFRRLLDLWKCSQAELARRLSVSPSHVSRMLNVLELPESAQADIAAGKVNYLEALRLREQAQSKASTTSAAAPRRRRPSVPRGTVSTPFGTVKLKRGAKLEELVSYLRTLVDQDKREAA